jgi:hypothetical protein
MTMWARVLLILVIVSCVLGARPAAAAGLSVPGLTLQVAPIVDVGGSATFSLTAKKWPASARASIRFLSPHHGFSGDLLWDVTCHCFRLAVGLAKRVHRLEPATAWATVRAGTGTQIVSTRFQIRGMASGGKTYASGGKAFLTAWVSDRSPLVQERQHFCAWIHASDAFPMRGVHVRFQVHYAASVQKINGGKTGTDGVTCKQVKVPSSAPTGLAVPVDTYAGPLHMRVNFTPRA